MDKDAITIDFQEKRVTSSPPSMGASTETLCKKEHLAKVAFQ